jgi:putative salt-induced outer membrane protein YdiY
MKFTSPSLGDMSIKLENIKSYAADSATLRLENRVFVSGAIKEGNATQITLADGKTYNAADVARVNPPAVGWTGSIVANGSIIRGNSNTEALGLTADATLRRDTPENDDRFILSASDNYARQGRGAGGSATADNSGANIAYNIFFSDKFYGYGDVGYYRDHIAALNYRLTPGVGIGYQWFEQKDFNFSTEAGISYLYQEYEIAPSVSQDAAYRLAYHLDKALNDKVKVFNDVEYIAPLKPGESNRYILNADAGIRANFTKSFFTEFKVVYNRNDHPARVSPGGPSRLKDDLAYTLGVGWQF